MGDLATVEEMLRRPDAGQLINSRGNAQWTPVIYASIQGHAHVLRALLLAGADVDARALFNETALMAAAFNGNGAAIDVLLEAGADVSLRSSDGITAIEQPYENTAAIRRKLKEAAPARVRRALWVQKVAAAQLLRIEAVEDDERPAPRGAVVDARGDAPTPSIGDPASSVPDQREAEATRPGGAVAAGEALNSGEKEGAAAGPHACSTRARQYASVYTPPRPTQADPSSPPPPSS